MHFDRKIDLRHIPQITAPRWKTQQGQSLGDHAAPQDEVSPARADGGVTLGHRDKDLIQ